MNTLGGRALDRDGGREPYQLEPNSEYRGVLSGRHTAGAKVRSGEGNSPDHQLRSLNHVLSGKGCGKAKTTRRLA